MKQDLGPELECEKHMQRRYDLSIMFYDFL